MRFIKAISAIAAFASAALACAATLTPIQLLSPSGSTAGQAIVSTGASTAPTWGTFSAANLAPIAANTVLGNTTGSSAAPSASAIPGCGASGNSLNYTSGTGFGCVTGLALTANPLSQFSATTSAQLAGVLSDESGTGAAVFATTPTITRPNIVGTNTNDNATAGSVGEYSTNSSTGTALTSNVVAGATSVQLSAGDWDVTGVALFPAGASTTVTRMFVGINTSVALGTNYQKLITSFGNDNMQVSSPVTRISLSATTTVYLIAQATFSGGPLTVDGVIRARRVR